MSLIMGNTFIGFNLKVTDACGVMNKKDKKTPYTFCPIGSRLSEGNIDIKSKRMELFNRKSIGLSGSVLSEKL